MQCCWDFFTSTGYIGVGQPHNRRHFPKFEAHKRDTPHRPEIWCHRETLTEAISCFKLATLLWICQDTLPKRQFLVMPFGKHTLHIIVYFSPRSNYYIKVYLSMMIRLSENLKVWLNNGQADKDMWATIWHPKKEINKNRYNVQCWPVLQPPCMLRGCKNAWGGEPHPRPLSPQCHLRQTPPFKNLFRNSDAKLRYYLSLCVYRMFSKAQCLKCKLSRT